MSNRIIKFRAWDERKEVMHTNVNFIKTGDAGNDWIVFSSDQAPYDTIGQASICFNNPYFSQQIKLMQFTGLYDKNNEEIYEGDIVKRKRFLSGKDEYVSVIIFKDGCFCLEPEITIINDYAYQYAEIEIIGNIYQSPELLNEKNEKI
jgi:uncharacterized phage protein (TIGR01671 family)